MMKRPVGRRNAGLGRWFALGVAAAALAGGLAACRETPQPISPRRVPHVDCREQQLIQLKLEELAMSAMETFGRIDPYLFEGSLESGKLSVNGEPQERRGFRPQLERALKTVESDGQALRTFLAGQAAARVTCGKDCPPTVYEFDVRREQLPEGDGFTDHFEVRSSEGPSDIEWKEGFLRQYTYAQPECFPYVALIRLIEPEVDPADKGNQAKRRYRKGKGERSREGNCQGDKGKCDGCKVGESNLRWQDVGDGDYCCRSTC
jgi:hypothetical protein